jgi:excisionase family DNA binding protein
MNASLPNSEKWYSLSEAARQLNIHPTTLRRWADNGDIPVLITPGGHRRFAASDIVQFAQARRSLSFVNNLEKLWADRALVQTRQEITDRQDENQWLIAIDKTAREHSRLLGRQLMALMLQYISNGGDDAVILREGRRIGIEYGHFAQANGLLLTDALQASIFFRDMMIETALQLPESANIRPEANLQLLRRINTLLNAVHLAVASVYEV